jgi:hypothetical protein
MAVLVSYKPLLSNAAQVVCGSNNSDDSFQVTELDLTLLISGELMVFIVVSGGWVHEPFVHHLHRESSIGSHLTIFPIHTQEILVFLLFQKDITHI